MINLGESPRGLLPSLTSELGGNHGQERGGDASGSVSGLPARVQRLGVARGRAVEMLDFLRDNGKPRAFDPVRHRAADRLQHCAEYLLFRHYTDQDEVKLHRAHFCQQHLVCPVCAIRRGSKMVGAYLERLKIVQDEAEAAGRTLRPYMLTYTVKNGFDLAKNMQHLRSGLETLKARRRRARAGDRGHRTTWADVAGAVGACEVTYSARHGWHSHAHIFALCEAPFDVGGMSEEWHRITGDSFITEAHPVWGEPAEAFCEVFKYALKFSSMDHAKTWEAATTLARQRLVFSLGNLWGVQVPEALTDGELCGPFVELFYRYLGGGHYGLAKGGNV